MATKAVDLSEFEALSAPAQRESAVDRALKALAPADRRKLEAALTRQSFTHVAICKWLAARGITVGEDSVRRYRRRHA